MSTGLFARAVRALPLLGAAIAVSCVLPAGFRGEVNSELEQVSELPQQNRPRSVPAVIVSAAAFADPRPRQAEPAWLGARIASFQSDAVNAADLLRLAAAAADVFVELRLSGLPSVSGFVFGGGTAKQLMVKLAGRLGLFWRAEADRVVFFDTQTRVFDLADFRDSAPLAGSDSSRRTRETGGRRENADRWSNLERRVQLLAGEGAEVAVSAIPGTLTVRASVQGMRAVEAYISELNQQLARQVELDVKLLQVALSDRRGAGLDWSAVHRSLSLHSGEAELDAAAGRRFVIARQPDGTAGNSAIFRAFADQGKVRLLTNPRGVTLNGRAIDIALVTQTAYLARVLAGGIGRDDIPTEAGLEPGIVESGFLLQILPKIRGQQVLLQLQARLSSLQDLNQVSSGEQSIQIPTLSESRFSHWAQVRSGDTLVLGGVRQLRDNASAASLLDQSSVKERTEQVLLVTPRIL